MSDPRLTRNESGDRKGETVRRFRLVGSGGQPHQPDPRTEAGDPGAGLRVIGIASPKGGVGKSHLALNLAVALARRGRQALLVDGAPGLHQLNLLTGAEPTHDVTHVLAGTRRLDEVVILGPEGIRYLPAASSGQEAPAYDAEIATRLLPLLGGFAIPGDIVLVDLPGGIHPQALDLASVCGEILLVTTPELPSWLHAVTLMKRMPRAAFRVVVNRVRTVQEAADTFARIVAASLDALADAPTYWGYVSEDPAVQEAVRRQRPFVLIAPGAPASRQIEKLARRVTEEEPPGTRRRAARPLAASEIESLRESDPVPVWKAA